MQHDHHNVDEYENNLETIHWSNDKKDALGIILKNGLALSQLIHISPTMIGWTIVNRLHRKLSDKKVIHPNTILT